MDALVMCGGAGTRLDADVEKPLLGVDGEPMVDRVLDALAASRIERSFAVVSPQAPVTAEHVAGPTIETAGEGYVADLRRALADERVVQPVLTVAADLPVLSGSVVDDVLDAYGEGSLTVAVPVERKRALGVSVDSTFDHEGQMVAPSGVNVVGEGEREGEGAGAGADSVCVLAADRLAVNVNRPRDALVAEALAETY